MPTVEEQIKHLQGYDPKTPCAMHLWLPDDVRNRAFEKGYKVTDEQVARILDRMEHKCDSSIGLNWDVLDCYIEEIEDELEKDELEKDGTGRVFG